MTKNLRTMLVAVALLTGGVMAEAQQSGKIYRIGYLESSTLAGATPFLEVLKRRLRELGWVEGKNFIFEHRFGEGKGDDRIKELAAELVRLKVDIIVARSSSVVAAKQATSTIPIIMVSVGDPVGIGIVKSLAQPGGNITGISSLSQDLNTKRLEVLKDVVPKLNLVGVLLNERGGVGTERQIKELDPAAKHLGLKLLYLETKGDAKGLENAFETARRQRVNALTTLSLPAVFAAAKPIVEMATKHRLPAMYIAREFVDVGGLMSYGNDFTEQYYRAAYFIDRILKGTQPADLPVELPMKYEFIINLKAAKQIGITIPYELLARANQVIK